jgi:hypothetical protein
MADLCALNGDDVTSGALRTGDGDSGLLEGVFAAGMIARGGYFAKNFINRGGRLLANAM